VSPSLEAEGVGLRPMVVKRSEGVGSRSMASGRGQRRRALREAGSRSMA
jgi:hypothetical protein